MVRFENINDIFEKNINNEKLLILKKLIYEKLGNINLDKFNDHQLGNSETLGSYGIYNICLSLYIPFFQLNLIEKKLVTIKGNDKIIIFEFTLSEEDLKKLGCVIYDRHNPEFKVYHGYLPSIINYKDNKYTCCHVFLNNPDSYTFEDYDILKINSNHINLYFLHNNSNFIPLTLN